MEACVELTQEQAFCKYTLSGDTRDIPAEEWRFERIGRLSFSAKHYGKIRTFIEEVCVKTEKCTEEQREKVEEFFGEMDHVMGVMR